MIRSKQAAHAAIGVVVSIIIGLAGIAGSAAIDQAQANHQQGTCQEDEPCWNWKTMGDHRRGHQGHIDHWHLGCECVVHHQNQRVPLR